MPRFRISDYCGFVIAAWMLVGLAFLNYPLEAQDQRNPSTPTQTQSQNPFQLNVTSNLVVVRVVVRDAQGKPLEGLRKEDFRLFDQGKEQSISQFEVEAPVTAASSTAIPTPGQTSSPLPPAPQKFIALNFDVFNTSDADLIQARDAADRFLATNLHPNERVAIFASGEMLSDFTADLTQLHKALLKLRVLSTSQGQTHECPHLSDYQALEITQSVNENTEAWIVAINEASQCPGASVPPPMPPPSSMGTPTSGSQAPPPDPLKDQIRMLAMRIVGETHVLVRSNLDGLEHVVSYLARMPGQRTVILVSPGFLSQSEQPGVDQIIDQALRSQVLISALDSKGLAILLREGDATQAYMPSLTAIADPHTMESRRESAAVQVLAEVAYGTGGEFFHNNNDLKGGLSVLASSPVSYILTFAPNHVKTNGQFHTVKVTLASKQKGITIQARRGYFAPTKATVSNGESQQQESSATLPAKTTEPVSDAAVPKIEPQPVPAPPGATQAASVALPPNPALQPEKADESKASAKPTYVDYSSKKLQSTISALNGLKPDSDQSNLVAIMEKVGQSIADSLQKIPDLISREDTYYLKVDNSSHPNVTGFGVPISPKLQLPQSTHCNYLILFDRDSSGAARVEEYRTQITQENGGLTDKSQSVHGFGFVNEWFLFSPANQPDFRFRYLGEQDIHGRKTYVVVFAQIPERTHTPAKFSFGGSDIPFLFQGVMWIDQRTSEIVSLRTDLQVPVPRIGFQGFTTELNFRSVRIKKIEAELWLPQDVEITVSQADGVVKEVHHYSDYRLYRAQTRILP
jgi:VWFA-related protein